MSKRSHSYFKESFSRTIATTHRQSPTAPFPYEIMKLFLTSKAEYNTIQGNTNTFPQLIFKRKSRRHNAKSGPALIGNISIQTKIILDIWIKFSYEWDKDPRIYHKETLYNLIQLRNRKNSYAIRCCSCIKDL